MIGGSEAATIEALDTLITYEITSRVKCLSRATPG
jgi:hypothetical protein